MKIFNVLFLGIFIASFDILVLVLASDVSVKASKGEVLSDIDSDLLEVFTPKELELLFAESALRPEFNAIDPEASMTIEEVIRYHGYPVEIYEVQTKDGYIITVQRIPYGKKGPGTKPRKPVLIQHGHLCTSGVWIANTPDKNLPYLLAEEGYDAWLGNVRGTKYGNKHISLSYKDSRFWKFSVDEFAKYDVPAIIEKMLNVTGFKQIYYIGQSWGTTTSFALLATQPKYNEIIRTSFALAPVARVSHVRGPTPFAASLYKKAKTVFSLFGIKDYIPGPNHIKLVEFLGKTLCSSSLKLICANMIFLVVGFNLPQLNTSRAAVYLKHTPGTTSTQSLVHLGQMFTAKEFQMFDWGATENKKRYGKITPPKYDLGKITTQVALFWSDNDLLADPADVNWLATQLGNLVLKYRVPLKKFSHMDFLWALDVKPLLYNKLIDVMNKLWRD